MINFFLQLGSKLGNTKNQMSTSKVNSDDNKKKLFKEVCFAQKFFFDNFSDSAFSGFTCVLGGLI